MDRDRFLSGSIGLADVFPQRPKQREDIMYVPSTVNTPSKYPAVTGYTVALEPGDTKSLLQPNDQKPALLAGRLPLAQRLLQEAQQIQFQQRVSELINLPVDMNPASAPPVQVMEQAVMKHTELLLQLKDPTKPLSEIIKTEKCLPLQYNKNRMYALDELFFYRVPVTRATWFIKMIIWFQQQQQQQPPPPQSQPQQPALCKHAVSVFTEVFLRYMSSGKTLNDICKVEESTLAANDQFNSTLDWSDLEQWLYLESLFKHLCLENLIDRQVACSRMISWLSVANMVYFRTTLQLLSPLLEDLFMVRALTRSLWVACVDLLEFTMMKQDQQSSILLERLLSHIFVKHLDALSVLPYDRLRLSLNIILKNQSLAVFLPLMNKMFDISKAGYLVPVTVEAEVQFENKILRFLTKFPEQDAPSNLANGLDYLVYEHMMKNNFSPEKLVFLLMTWACDTRHVSERALLVCQVLTRYRKCLELSKQSQCTVIEDIIYSWLDLHADDVTSMQKTIAIFTVQLARARLFSHNRFVRWMVARGRFNVDTHGSRGVTLLRSLPIVKAEVDVPVDSNDHEDSLKRNAVAYRNEMTQRISVLRQSEKYADAVDASEFSVIAEVTSVIQAYMIRECNCPGWQLCPSYSCLSLSKDSESHLSVVSQNDSGIGASPAEDYMKLNSLINRIRELNGFQRFEVSQWLFTSACHVTLNARQLCVLSLFFEAAGDHSMSLTLMEQELTRMAKKRELNTMPFFNPDESDKAMVLVCLNIIKTHQLSLVSMKLRMERVLKAMLTLVAPVYSSATSSARDVLFSHCRFPVTRQLVTWLWSFFESAPRLMPKHLKQCQNVINEGLLRSMEVKRGVESITKFTTFGKFLSTDKPEQPLLDTEVQKHFPASFLPSPDPELRQSFVKLIAVNMNEKKLQMPTPNFQSVLDQCVADALRDLSVDHVVNVTEPVSVLQYIHHSGVSTSILHWAALLTSLEGIDWSGAVKESMGSLPEQALFTWAVFARLVFSLAALGNLDILSVVQVCILIPLIEVVRLPDSAPKCRRGLGFAVMTLALLKDDDENCFLRQMAGALDQCAEGLLNVALLLHVAAATPGAPVEASSQLKDLVNQLLRSKILETAISRDPAVFLRRFAVMHSRPSKPTPEITVQMLVNNLPREVNLQLIHQLTSPIISNPSSLTSPQDAATAAAPAPYSREFFAIYIKHFFAALTRWNKTLLSFELQSMLTHMDALRNEMGTHDMAVVARQCVITAVETKSWEHVLYASSQFSSKQSLFLLSQLLEYLDPYKSLDVDGLKPGWWSCSLMSSMVQFSLCEIDVSARGEGEKRELEVSFLCMIVSMVARTGIEGCKTVCALLLGQLEEFVNRGSWADQTDLTSIHNCLLLVLALLLPKENRSAFESPMFLRWMTVLCKLHSHIGDPSIWPRPMVDFADLLVSNELENPASGAAVIAELPQEVIMHLPFVLPIPLPTSSVHWVDECGDSHSAKIVPFQSVDALVNDEGVPRNWPVSLENYKTVRVTHVHHMFADGRFRSAAIQHPAIERNTRTQTRTHSDAFPSSTPPRKEMRF